MTSVTLSALDSVTLLCLNGHMDSFTDHIDQHHRRAPWDIYRLRWVRIHQGIEIELDVDTVDCTVNVDVEATKWDLEDAESYGEGTYQVVLDWVHPEAGAEVERRTVHVVQHQLTLEV